MIRRPPRSTLFPYTTLFRSMLEAPSFDRERAVRKPVGDYTLFMTGLFPESVAKSRPTKRPRLDARSEEHTSELQSQSNIVCRLLLATMNNINRRRRSSRTPL